MIYRGPGFLAVERFSSCLLSLSQSSCVSPVELTDGRGGVGERAWFSINHSILSASLHGRGQRFGEEPNHMTARMSGLL
jgi:hypothetical protein